MEFAHAMIGYTLAMISRFACYCKVQEVKTLRLVVLPDNFFVTHVYTTSITTSIKDSFDNLQETGISV